MGTRGTWSHWTGLGICDSSDEQRHTKTPIQHYFIVYEDKRPSKSLSAIVIIRICHDQKSHVSGAMGLLTARHSNPKYISTTMENIHSEKKGRYFDIHYVTLYIPMGSIQIS